MERAQKQTCGTPWWLRDLEHQVRARNTAELRPSEALFASYMALHTRVRMLDVAEQDRRRLTEEHTILTARVRELERVAADTSMRSAREGELERRLDGLQERLQGYMEKENSYYKAMAELSEWRCRIDELRCKAQTAEDELARRTAETNLVKKEYVSLRDENEVMRRQLCETDRLRTELHNAHLELAALRQQVQTRQSESSDHRPVEDEVEALACAVALEHETQRVPHDRPGMVEAEVTGAAIDPGVVHSDPQGGTYVPSRATDLTATIASATSVAATGLYPSRVAYVIDDAHRGTNLQAVCFTEDGQQILSAGSDKLIRIWNTSGGEGKRYFTSGSLVLSLHSTSHYLLAGCADRVVRFWDLYSLRALELAGHEEKVIAVCLSGSAQHAFSASSDGTIRVWDVRHRSLLRTFLCMSTGNDVTVAGDVVFSAHYNGTVALWDRRTAVRVGEVRAHQRIATCVRVSPDGLLCVSMGRDNAISVRDVRQLQSELHHVCPVALTVPMNLARLAVSPDSAVCAAGNAQGDVLLLRLKVLSDSTRQDCTTTNADNEMDVLAVLNKGGHGRGKPVYGVAWGGDAAHSLISLGEDRRLVVWR